MTSFLGSPRPLSAERQVEVCEANLRATLLVSISQQAALNSDYFTIGREEYSWTSTLTSGPLVRAPRCVCVCACAPRNVR